MAGFEELFRALGEIPDGIDNAMKKGLKKGAVIVMKRAKLKLGTYQPGWPALKPETVRKKHMSKTQAGRLTRAGRRYLREHGSWGTGGNDDSPLVDKGHLKQAITTDFSELDQGVAYVGVAAGSGENGSSTADYAKIHEFGGMAGRGHRVHVPARPFLRPSLEESKEQIKDAVAQAIVEELRRFGR
ncbi:phage virion morphogenesis protein [Aneurinibacillus terranovensis]|uniref:phage virion morphogenesis protein n=1 Tax=Aneurinibacillus terranovensis TaxID=278991 RepID=UPI0004241FA6|nr:phage virion morphogenesis protein [Aneurinibacillus terranovensis]